MEGSRQNYWIDFVDKLSIGNELEHMVPKVLEDLCRTFDFGCGFYYEADHHRVMYLRASFEGYANCNLALEISMDQQLDNELQGQLAGELAVCFRDDLPPETDLEVRMSGLFSAKSLVLVPVVDEDRRVVALVGLADRRGKGRHAQEDIEFCRSIISILANYIKMQIYKQRAENSHRSLEGILDNMGIDVYVNDFDTHEMLYLNRSMAAPYGTVEEMQGRICWQALYNDKTGECDFCPQKKLIDEEGNPTKVFSWDYQRPFDKSWFRVFSSAFRWVDGRMAHIVSSVDITENKQNEEIVRRLAEFDYLTGLPNRFSLTQYIDSVTVGGPGPAQEGYVVFFDLDGFKQVNDTRGHKEGDELLRRVADRLQASALTRGHSYRYGGDEFVVLVNNETPGTLQDVLDYLAQLFNRDPAGGIEVGASIGVAHYPNDADQTGELLRKADQAMYASKHDGRGKVRFYNGGDICAAESCGCQARDCKTRSCEVKDCKKKRKKIAAQKQTD